MSEQIRVYEEKRSQILPDSAKQYKLADAAGTRADEAEIPDLSPEALKKALARPRANRTLVLQPVVSGWRINAECWKLIAETAWIESLEVQFSNFDSLDLKPLVKMKNLKKLVLANSNVNDKGVEIIGNMDQLLNLTLDNTPITNKSATAIASISSLEDLHLGRTTVNNDGIKTILTHNKKLRIFRLKNNRNVNDETLAMLSTVPLEEIELQDTKISDDGLSKLEAEKNLRTIFLDNTNISIDALTRLCSAVPKLTRLGLRHCERITDADLQKLKERFPRLELYNPY